MGNTQPGRHVPWRRDPVILARLPQVERMHLRRMPNTAIAAALQVDEKTIRRDLEHIRELWRERTAGEIADVRARAVAELDDLKERALAAAEWDQQCEQAVLYGTIVELGGEQRLVYRDEKGSATFRGQKAQALNVARQAIMDKAKVQG